MIIIGVAGSVIGRLILAYYIPVVADRILKPEKNEDIRLLGEKIKTKGLKAQLFILVYTLLPLSSTPLFIAGGMARISPFYIIPVFLLVNLPLIVYMQKKILTFFYWHYFFTICSCIVVVFVANVFLTFYKLAYINTRT